MMNSITKGLVVFFLVISTSVSTAQKSIINFESREQELREESHITIQDICFVCGRDLKIMGNPIKVKVNNEILHICCKECSKKSINSKHWLTIHNNFFKAQRICPVMKDVLPKSAKWTIVDGNIIYVCCKPCIKQIIKDKKLYLRKLDELYLETINSRKGQ